MENEQTFDFSAFEEGFGSIDYQNEDAATDEGTESQEATEGSVSEENSEAENGQENEENPAEEGTEPDEAKDSESGEQMFTIKVNKEERQVGLSEMTALAQKGADYDRVKGQVEELRTFKTANQQLVDVVNEIAKANNVSVDSFLQTLRVNIKRAGGIREDVAFEQVKREDAERKLSAFEAQKQSEDQAAEERGNRATREVKEFQQKFPGVVLNRESLMKLQPYIDQGKTLADAYQQSQIDAQKAEIEQLKSRLASAQLTAKNSKAPGSMRDSGATSKTQFDDFWDAFK